MDKSTLETYIIQGLSTHQIAKLTSKSQTTIRYWLNKYNLKSKNLSFSQGFASKDKIIENGVEYKVCACCQIKKELLKDFYTKNGKYSHAWCKTCSNKNTVAIQQNKKIQAVNYKGGKCVKCNYSKYVGALEFHHPDPSKKDFTIAQRKNCSLEAIKSELDKCILLCKNCHAELHFEERSRKRE